MHHPLGGTVYTAIYFCNLMRTSAFTFYFLQFLFDNGSAYPNIHFLGVFFQSSLFHPFYFPSSSSTFKFFGVFFCIRLFLVLQPFRVSLCQPYTVINSLNNFVSFRALQWGAADAEIKVPSVENTELKRSPFKAWSRSVYSHIC